MLIINSSAKVCGILWETFYSVLSDAANVNSYVAT